MSEEPQGLLPGDEVLVTGATGFTGAVLVRRLAAAGCRVRAIARASSHTAQFDGLPITWYRGDVFDPRVIREAVDGARYILHVAASYREGRLDEAQHRLVHLDSTRFLAMAAREHDGFRRMVLVSTVGVHGHIDNPPADEDYRFAPGDEYQRTKAEAEQWLRDYARESGLSYAVIRPAAIYGPGDRRLLKLFRMATLPVFPLLGSGRCLYHLIHVEDLAAAIVRAAWHPAAEGRAFICGNPEPVSLLEIGRIVADELKAPFRPVRIPAWPFFLAATACEAVCKPLGIEPPLYRRRVAFFTKDRAFNTARLRQVLGYQVQYGNEEGIRATARWYVAHQWLRRG